MEFGTHRPDPQLRIPLYRLLQSVTVKPTCEGCKVGPAGHPLGPLVSGLCTLPPHVRYTPGVTLILMEFQISLYFLEMLQFGTYVPEIK
jgi:hypothetical protein